jgi:ribulose-phosphate 3-epimerase
MVQLAPSILSADFSKLAEEVSAVERAGAHLLHVDVMDGHFVPHISYGPVVMKSLLGKTSLPFDVHLMVEEPDRYIEDFVTENTKRIAVHQEACAHLNWTISYIRRLGVGAGVSINPATPLSTLEYVLEYVDSVLIMSVNPGFAGQKFIPSALEKIKWLRGARAERKLSFKIEIDGGVNLENLRAVTAAGADIVVAGSAVFKAADIGAWVNSFLEISGEA